MHATTAPAGIGQSSARSFAEQRKVADAVWNYLGIDTEAGFIEWYGNLRCAIGMIDEVADPIAAAETDELLSEAPE
ncbi:MAG TPA: hypothetical protein VNN79_15395 [Actinomycetota bacterium]|nr:hypothetical protein [Actinomycetota bacterium]